MKQWKENVIMHWDAEKVSDHGRGPLTVTPERIERKERMVDGTMRKYFVAIKHTFSTSWENLPSLPGTNGPVDGGLSAKEMEAFSRDVNDPFTLTLRDGQGETETFNVYIEEFSYEINKRGVVDWWNVDLTLVEV